MTEALRAELGKVFDQYDDMRRAAGFEVAGVILNERRPEVGSDPEW